MVGPLEQHGPLLPANDDRALHARLLSRDPTAPSDLARGHLDGLVRRLHAHFPQVDDHLVQDVAITLILSLAQRPEQYDPNRSPLASYLRMAASGDLKNALRSEQRRSRRLVALADVELAHPTGNSFVESPTDPAELVAAAEFAESHTMALFRSQFDPLEREFVQLYLDGERRTPAFAAVLGIEHWAPAEQAREVKKVKDRLLKRLRRLAPKVRRDD